MKVALFCVFILIGDNVFLTTSLSLRFFSSPFLMVRNIRFSAVRNVIMSICQPVNSEPAFLQVLDYRSGKHLAISLGCLDIPVPEQFLYGRYLHTHIY